MQLPQGRAGFDAQLGHQGAPRPAVGRECVGLPTGAVQRQHEHPAQLLPQRVLADQRGQFGDHITVTSQSYVEVEAGLQDVQPRLVQPGALGLGQRAGDSGQRRSLPLVERGVQQFRRGGHLARGAQPLRLGDPLLEHAQVQGVFGYMGQVSVRGRDDHLRRAARVPAGLQHLAQTRHVGA